MALNYDVRENKNAFREISKEEYESNSNKQSFFQCPKYEEDGKYYEMTKECNMLIMLLGLSIGIPNLDEKNAEQVFNRISILEDTQGTFLKVFNPQTKKAEPFPFTLEMVKENVGIKTNGITLTRSEFEKKVLNQIFSDKKI